MPSPLLTHASRAALIVALLVPTVPVVASIGPHADEQAKTPVPSRTTVRVRIPDDSEDATPPARPQNRRAEPVSGAVRVAPTQTPESAPNRTGDSQPTSVRVRPGGSTQRTPAAPPVQSQAVIMTPTACEQVRLAGNARREALLSHLNIAMSGRTHFIDRTSALVVHRVNDIEFRGCDFRVFLDVSVERDGARNSQGAAQASARINHHDPRSGEFCFESPPRISSMDVRGGRHHADLVSGASMTHVRVLPRCISNSP